MSEVKTIDDRIDQLEGKMQGLPESKCVLTHIFSPRLYTRKIYMPKGSLITSKIHKTEHPFVVLEGVVSVFTETDGEVLIAAPYMGITKPGTRRVLYCHEDTVWATFHVLDFEGETLDQIEARIIEPHVNAYLENCKNIETNV